MEQQDHDYGVRDLSFGQFGEEGSQHSFEVKHPRGLLQAKNGFLPRQILFRFGSLERCLPCVPSFAASSAC